MASSNVYDDCENIADFKESKQNKRKSKGSSGPGSDHHSKVKYGQGVKKYRPSIIRHKKMYAINREKERNKKPRLVNSDEEDRFSCVDTTEDEINEVSDSLASCLCVDKNDLEKPAISNLTDKDGRTNYIKLLTKLIDLNMPSKIESNRSTEAYSKRLFFLEKRRNDWEKGGYCNQLFCNELFWLELQHRFKNRTSDRIKNVRLQSLTKVSKIARFKVVGAEIEASDIQREKIYLISKSYLTKIKVAYDQVSQELARYNYLLTFWPTTSNMSKYMADHSNSWMTEESEVNENIETLQAWYSCCEWLNWKTRQICQLVGITGHCLHTFIMSGYQDNGTEDLFDNVNDKNNHGLPDLTFEDCKRAVSRSRCHSLNLGGQYINTTNVISCESCNDVLTDADCETKFETYADLSRRRYGFAKVCNSTIESVKPMLTKFQNLLSITKDENRLPLMFSYAEALKKEGSKSRSATPNTVNNVIFSENVSEGSVSSYMTATLDTQHFPTITQPISSKLFDNNLFISAVCSPAVSSNPSQHCLDTEYPIEVYPELNELPFKMQSSFNLGQETLKTPQKSDVKGLLGLRNKVAARLNLPPLLPHYLFLARFPLKIMHCCIKKMLSTTDWQKIGELSIITIKQKILDFKEALQRTMEAREFLRNITYGINFQIYKFQAPNTKDFAPKQDLDHSEFMRTNLREIDGDLSILLRHYINCLKELLKKWNQPSSFCKFGQSEPRRLLDEEWNFVKTYCHSIKQEEEIVASSFCNLAEYLLDLLKTDIETSYKLNLDYDISPTDYPPVFVTEDEVGTISSMDNRRMSKSCQTYKNRCKIVQSQLKQATDFAKRLRADLEISIQLELNTNYSMNDFLGFLSRTKHKMVTLCSPDETIIKDCPNDLTLIIPEESCSYLNELLHPLVTGFSLQPKDECIVPSLHNSSSSKSTKLALLREYILIINKKSKMHWPGDKIPFFYPLDMGNLKQRIESSNIVFIARRPDELTEQLTQLLNCKISLDSVKSITFKDIIQSCSDGQVEACHYNSKRTLNALKSKSIEIGNTLQNFFISDEKELFQDTDCNIPLNRIQEETLKSSIKNSYSITFEFYRDLIKLCTGDAFKNTLKNSILNLLEKWFKFSELFEPSEKGTVPRWANDGLNFLLQLCKSRIVVNMTTKEWQDFRKNIDNFVEFIVGQGSKHGSQASAKSTSSSKVVTSRSWLTRPKPDIIQGCETKITNSNKIGNWQITYDSNRALRSAFSEPNRASQHTGDINTFDNYFSNRINSCKYNEAPDNVNEDTFTREVNTLIESVEDSQSTNKSTDGSSMEDNKGRKRLSFKQNIEQLEKRLDEKQRVNKLIGFVRDSNSDMSSSLYIKKAPFQWIKKGSIGQGHAGTVYKVYNLDTMEIMAMKEIVINEPFSQDRIESDLLCKLKFPSLLKYYGVDISLSHVRIFTEYCDSGSLSQVSILEIPEIVFRQWTKQVLDAIVYLHDNNIVHRDVKPDNIFLINSEDGHVCYAKLGDFGVAKSLKNHEDGLKDIQGTMMYMAPEVVVVDSVENVSKRGYNHKVDIWSLGCVVLFMVNGKGPWPDMDQMSIYYNLGMKRQPLVIEENINPRMTKEARDFISSCITVNPCERPEAIELKNFNFVKLSDP